MIQLFLTTLVNHRLTDLGVSIVSQLVSPEPHFVQYHQQFLIILHHLQESLHKGYALEIFITQVLRNVS